MFRLLHGSVGGIKSVWSVLQFTSVEQ